MSYAKTRRKPDQVPTCTPIVQKDYRIEFAKPESDIDPALLVTKTDGTALKPWHLMSLDPSSACRNLYFVSEKNIIVLEMYEGESVASGGGSRTDSTVLYVFRITETKLHYEAQFPIEGTVPEQGEGSTGTLKTPPYQPPRYDSTKQKVILELTDSTGKTSSHFY